MNGQKYITTEREHKFKSWYKLKKDYDNFPKHSKDGEHCQSLGSKAKGAALFMILDHFTKK